MDPPATDLEAELALTERVGRELARLEMHKHVGLARAYYAAVRGARKPERWSHDLVVEWARVLRVPPHDRDYPVRPRMTTCACAAPRVHTRMVFTGGSLAACAGCGERWLELDGEASSTAA